MSIKAIFLVLMCLFSIHAGSALAAVKAPTEVVKRTVDGILAVLRNKETDWYSKQKAIEATIDQRFDFWTISQSVLGPTWRRATPSEREQFVEFFSQYLQQTYTQKMLNYTNEYVRYGKETVKGDWAEVETFIVRESGDIPVTYKMRLKDGKWFAYDVVIEGISLVSSYRDTYAAIAKTGGVQGVLEELQGKIEAYKRERGTKSRQ
jgi:phospholipid transport system substrate-binding protein